MSSTETRFNAAVAAVQAQGVHLKLNVMECCRGCIGHEKLELPSREALDTTPYAYQYGGQGSELVWRNGQPFYLDEPWDDEDEDEEDGFYASRRHQKRDERCAHTVYFNHGGPDLVAAQALVEIFRGGGFTVDWDGTKNQCVIVHLV